MCELCMYMIPYMCAYMQVHMEIYDTCLCRHVLIFIDVCVFCPPLSLSPFSLRISLCVYRVFVSLSLFLSLYTRDVLDMNASGGFRIQIKVSFLALFRERSLLHSRPSVFLSRSIARALSLVYSRLLLANESLFREPLCLF